MKVLAVSNLFPSSLEPTRATFNRQHFEHLSTTVELELIVPLAWLARLRGGTPKRVDEVAGAVKFATFWYTPKVLSGWHGAFCHRSIQSLFASRFEQQHPDLIYATWIYPDGFAAAKLAKGRDKPIVVKAHGSDLHSIGAGRASKTQDTLAMADRIVTVSNSQTELAIRAGVNPDKLSTIYNGIDHQRFAIMDQAECRQRLNLEQDIPLLVAIGNLKPIKGFDLLLESISAGKFGELQVVVVGQGAMRQTLLGMIDSLGLTKQVRLVGGVDHAQVPIWINAADALALTSVNEGVPNVLLEAQACGVPVVATDVGGVAEVVDHQVNGYLVAERSAHAFAEGLKWVLGRQWSPECLRESSKRFSWHTNAKQTQAVFQQVA